MTFDAILGALGTPRLTVTYVARPWTENESYRWHHMKRARMVAEWREAFWGLALGQKARPLPTPVVIVVDVEVRTNQSKADPAAAVGSVKAGIDGLVDANVIPDDRGEYLSAVIFQPPRVTGRDAVTLHVY